MIEFEREPFVFQDVIKSLKEESDPELMDLRRKAESSKISSMRRFASAVLKALKSSVASVRYKLMALYQLIMEQIPVMSQELEELRAHENKLQSALRNCESGVKKAVLYLTLYILLLVASFLLFSVTWAVIQPELPWWLGPAQAVVMVAPSILICQAYIRSPAKDRFLRFLHIIGLVAALLTGIGVALSKAVFYTMINNASTSSVLGTSSGSWVDTMQLVASGVTFVALVVTDAALGGRLAILVYENFEAKRPIETMKVSLEETVQKREKLEAELRELNLQREAIENFDDISEKFIDSTLEKMLLIAEIAQLRLDGIARNRANGWFDDPREGLDVPREEPFSPVGAEREDYDEDD